MWWYCSSLGLFVFVVIKISAISGWWHVFKLPRSFLKTTTPLRGHTETPVTSSLLRVALLPSWKCFRLRATISRSLSHLALYFTELFTPLKSSPRLDLLHSYNIPIPKALLWTWSSKNGSSWISADTHATPSFPVFTTCNAPISAGSYG